MKNDYIELKQHRDVGAIITVFFDFLKQNIKNFTNIFINYNGIFILLFLGISYLMVTGGIGLIKGNENELDWMTNSTSLAYLGIGGILFFMTLVVMAGLNYSLSTAYLIQYEKEKTLSPVKGEVWKIVKDNSGNILIYILLLIILYLGFSIISLILAIIPILGMIIQYIIQFGFTAWVGVSFAAMMSENSSPSDGLGEGWKLVKENFWQAVGVNFILGILLSILVIVLLMIPGGLIGFYTYNIVESGVDISQSPVAKIVYTIGLSFFLILLAYIQSLSQFINGILYYSLHEKAYNTNTRNKIDQIGAGE